MRKHVTSAGHIRFLAEDDASHCDRFWAMALRQHAAQRRAPRFAAVVW